MTENPDLLVPYFSITYPSEPGGARTHDLRIKSLVGPGPKCGENQCKTWIDVGFSRARAPPIWEIPVPKLTQELTQALAIHPNRVVVGVESHRAPEGRAGFEPATPVDSILEGQRTVQDAEASLPETGGPWGFPRASPHNLH